MLYQVTDWDDAYVNGGYIANADSYPPRWAEAAAVFRAAHPSERTGEGDRQGHLFRPAGAAKGLMVFIHGGYWLRFHPDDWSHLAAGALAAGWACLMPGYRLAPEARIADMAREVAAQIADVAGHVAGPIAICGHSAGGHLAARMVCAGGPLPEAVAARVTACLPISPLTDLRSLMRTTMNETLRIDAAEAAAESPALLAALSICPAGRLFFAAVYILKGAVDRKENDRGIGCGLLPIPMLCPLSRSQLFVNY